MNITYPSDKAEIFAHISLFPAAYVQHLHSSACSFCWNRNLTYNRSTIRTETMGIQRHCVTRRTVRRASLGWAKSVVIPMGLPRAGRLVPDIVNLRRWVYWRDDGTIQNVNARVTIRFYLSMNFYIKNTMLKTHISAWQSLICIQALRWKRMKW